MYNFCDIFWADLPNLPESSVQQGHRPVVIVSNNRGNSSSHTVNVIPITSKLKKTRIPTHVNIIGFGLQRESIVLAEQTMTLDKRCLTKKIGTIDDERLIKKIQEALMIQFNIVA